MVYTTAHMYRMPASLNAVVERSHITTSRILDDFPGVFFIVNNRCEILKTNRATATLFGIHHEDLLRMTLLKVAGESFWLCLKPKFDELKQSSANEAQSTFTCAIESPTVGTPNYHWSLQSLRFSTQYEGELYSIYGLPA
jgi:PAS domain-containing protein